MINEYDEYSASCEGDGTDSTVSDELNKLLTESDFDDLDSCLIDMENMNKKACSKERSNQRCSNFENTNHKILPWEKT